MTEEARMNLVRSAYGTVWPALEPIHAYNGLMKSFEMPEDAIEIYMDLAQVGLIEHVKGDEDPHMFWRLKSLAGIDDNNGWVKIFSHRDLFLPPGSYRLIRWDNGIVKGGVEVTSDYLRKFGSMVYDYHQPTHYERVNDKMPLF